MSANTIQISEKHAAQLSRTSSESVCRQNFSILRASSLKLAEKALRKHPAPSDIDNFDFRKATVTYDFDVVYFDSANTDSSVIEATRTYSRKIREETDDAVEWRLSMSTSTATITTAKRAYAAPGSYPFWQESDYMSGGPLYGKSVGAGSPINIKKVQEKIETGGVEKVFPSFKFELGFMCPQAKFKKLITKLIQSEAVVNQDVFKAGDLEFQPGELLFSGATYERIEEIVDEDTGETEIAYKINYTFDISISEEFIAGTYVLPKEQASGFAAKWSYFDGDEEIEATNEDGKKEKILVPKCAGAYASDVYTRTEFAKLIPSGITV